MNFRLHAGGPTQKCVAKGLVDERCDFTNSEISSLQHLGAVFLDSISEYRSVRADFYIHYVSAIYLYVSDPYFAVYDPFDASTGINDIVFDTVFEIFDYFLTAVLVYGVFQSIRGQPVSIFQSLSRCFRVILPVIGVVIIMGLISAAFGALFYVVEISLSETGDVINFLLVIIVFVFFIYIVLILSVIVPAAVVEGHVLSSFSRSIYLTKGNRWRLLGLWVLFLLLIVIVQYPAEFIGSAIGSNSSVLLLTWAAMAMISTFGAVVFTVVYYRLCLVKDGVDENEIAAVFD